MLKSYSPASTTHLPSCPFSPLLQTAKSLAFTVNSTTFDSPASSVVLPKLTSALIGLVGLRLLLPTYTCTTAAPARRPVFATFTLTLHSLPPDFGTTVRSAKENVVYDRPKPKGKLTASAGRVSKCRYPTKTPSAYLTVSWRPT